MKQVTDFIKEHVLALMCAAVAVMGLVAYFVWPLPRWYADLQAAVDERKSVHESLKGLNEGARTLPVVDPSVTEPPPLPHFPTKRIIDQGKQAIDQLTLEADKSLAAALQANQRQLLVPGSLPNPGNLQRQNFLNAYKRVTIQTGDGAENGIVIGVLKGTLPPTATELTAIEQTRTNQIMQNDLQIGADNVAVNQAEVDAKIAEMRARLPLEQRVLRAMNSLVYVSPTAVDIHPELAQALQPPDVVTIFNGQFSLWLQLAAFEAIVDANAGETDVLDAPVKHLVRLNVPMNFVNSQGGGGGGGYIGSDFSGPGATPEMAPEAGAAAATTDLKPDPTAAITPVFTMNPLGYASNTLFDPIPIQMILRVDVRKLPQVLAAIQGKLIKIKNVNYRTVDTGRALSEGYIYDKEGSTPLVEVTIDCDVLMLRPWLVNFMPAAVKAHFATLGTPAAAAPME